MILQLCHIAITIRFHVINGNLTLFTLVYFGVTFTAALVNETINTSALMSLGDSESVHMHTHTSAHTHSYMYTHNRKLSWYARTHTYINTNFGDHLNFYMI